MIFPAQIPKWIKWIYPRFIWQMAKQEKSIYLTFDDGPHPRITPFVLALLSKYNAKATFFCIGDRVNRYPEIFEQLKTEGHAVGNHTQQHLNGWKTSTEEYLNDVEKANELIQSNLFRPPYGRIKQSQYRLLIKKGYKIVMWTILSADYDKNIPKEVCSARVTDTVENGMIYLFHDSEKAEERMGYALEKLLEIATSKGFTFRKLDSMNKNSLTKR